MSTEEPVSNPVEKTTDASSTSAPASKSGKPKSSAKSSAQSKDASRKVPPPSGNKSYKPGEIVLARLKGFPPWPARIADPDNVPKAVTANRPSKNPQIFCVNYFPAGDFSWLHSKDIQPLPPTEIDKFLSGGHRKASGNLRQAYETAKDPEEWIETQETALKEKEAEDLAAQEDVDQLEEEEGSGGKRKRPAKADAKASKKSKGGKKADESAAPKSKASSSKKAAAPVSVPENQAPADDDPLASDPECVKVKDWRHKLQRAFLGKGLPTASEMDTYNELFTTIENYKGMTIEALQYSKIGKVMKKITTLEGIPRNEEFKLTERASKLMNEWADFITNSGGDKANGAAAETNGSAEAPKSEKKEVVATEEAAPAESAEKKEETSEAAEPAAPAPTEEANGKEESGEKMETEAA